MIENWIDRVAKVFEISYGKQTLLSYGGYEKDNFPETLPKEPCVLSYVAGVKAVYGPGYQTIFIWSGISEFHLTKTIDRSQIPFVQTFYRKIITAAAGAMKLGNQDDGIERFIIVPEGYGIQSAWAMQYGDELPHMGLIVHWEVKENSSGEFTMTL